MMASLRQNSGLPVAEADRVAIDDSPDFQLRLLEYINSSTPLASCRNCTGTSGKLVDHENLTRPAWKEDVGRPLEEMIDYPWLEKNLVHTDFDQDDCVTLKMNGLELRPVEREQNPAK